MKDPVGEAARRKRNRASQRERGRSHARAVKMAAGCADCGYNAHPAALDFDHRPGTVKSFDIGKSATRSVKAVQAEIDKCDVVCANCHRIRTYERRA